MKKNLNPPQADISFQQLETALQQSIANPPKNFGFFSSIYKTQTALGDFGSVKVENKRVGKSFMFQTLYFVPKKDFSIDVTPVKFNVGFSFYLNGRADCYLADLDTLLPMIPGTGIICVSNYGDAVLQLYKNEPFLNITLFIKTADFSDFMGDAVKSLPEDFIASLKNPNQYYGIGGTTDQRIKDLLTRVENDSFEGASKLFFMESAAMEVMGTQLSRLVYDQKNEPVDREKIDLAGQILKNTLNAPPTITELARQVGLNEFKLKKEFKKHYGTTVYKFSVECRMKKAMTLLIKDKLSVKETAYAIGYSNPNAFSNAFYKHCGYWPTEFVKQKLVYE